MKTFRRGGIHPAANKLTSNSPIRQITVPDEVTILLSQSIGKPSRPLVKAGETVSRGDKIAEADGIISANLHSPVSGTVKKIDKVRTSSGEWAKAIIITRMENEREEKENPRSQREVENLTPDEIKDIIGEAGIVGLGGATFPTKVKLSPPPGCTLKYLIINGAECEPYLTCDDRLMQEYAVEVVKGSRLLMRASGVVKTIIGIEENKPEAIEAMTAATAHEPDISVEILKKKYPQGGEKEMTEALLGIEIPEGKLPASVGVIVDNVATAYAVYDAVWNRRPLYQRIITVTGPSLTNPGNFLVPDGTNIKSLIDLAGGLPEDTGKVVIGGPMMGKAASFIDSPCTKGTSGILVLPEKMSRREKESPCVRCGRCVNACPMHLEPYLLMAEAKAEMWDKMKISGAMSCMECGSCAYSCPSYKPILDYIRFGKKEIRKL